MYSEDFRRLAFIKLQKYGCTRKTARDMCVSPSTISRWNKYGSWNKSRPKRGKTHDISGLLDTIANFFTIQGNEAATIKKVQRFLLINGIQKSVSSVWRLMRLSGMTRKRLSNKVLGQLNPEKVQAYKKTVYDIVKPDTLVVSIDECHFSERVQPLYGYSKKGVRCVLRNHTGSWKSFSLLMVIANDGTTFHTVRKGSINRECFGEFILDLPYPPDTVCILDNCTIHKKLQDVFEAKGFISLFLPPYAPMFQPIELAFSKTKGWYRNLWPWTNGVSRAIEDSVNSLTADDILAYFRHAHSQLVDA